MLFICLLTLSSGQIQFDLLRLLMEPEHYLECPGLVSHWQYVPGLTWDREDSKKKKSTGQHNSLFSGRVETSAINSVL